jgi:hypothetical protein
MLKLRKLQQETMTKRIIQNELPWFTSTLQDITESKVTHLDLSGTIIYSSLFHIS